MFATSRSGVDSLLLRTLDSAVGQRCTLRRTSIPQWLHSVKKLMTENPGLMACKFPSHCMTETVRISANKESKKKNRAEITSEYEKLIAARSEKNGKTRSSTESKLKKKHRLVQENKTKGPYRSVVNHSKTSWIY